MNAFFATILLLLAIKSLILYKDNIYIIFDHAFISYFLKGYTRESEGSQANIGHGERGQGQT